MTRLLNTHEMSQFYRVHPFTITRWIREGKFPGAQRQGKEWRVPVSSVPGYEPEEPPTEKTEAA